MYEMWFREAYRPLIEKGRLLAAVRPGDRRSPQDKGTSPGELFQIRIILVPGNLELGIEPKLSDFRANARIEWIEVTTISCLTNKSLVGCSPDSQIPELVKYHLGLIYNRVFKDTDEVSVIHWTYLEEENYESN